MVVVVHLFVNVYWVYIVYICVKIQALSPPVLLINVVLDVFHDISNVETIDTYPLYPVKIQPQSIGSALFPIRKHRNKLEDEHVSSDKGFTTSPTTTNDHTPRSNKIQKSVEVW